MKILKNQLIEAEFSRAIWVAKPEIGTTLADMVQPEYWAHITAFMKPGARIEVFPADNTWFAELYVRGVRDKAVDVFVLRSVVFDEQEAVSDGEEYIAKFCGPHAKWRVIRTKDNEVVQEGLEKNEALVWIESQKVAA